MEKLEIISQTIPNSRTRDVFLRHWLKNMALFNHNYPLIVICSGMAYGQIKTNPSLLGQIMGKPILWAWYIDDKEFRRSMIPIFTGDVLTECLNVYTKEEAEILKMIVSK